MKRLPIQFAGWSRWPLAAALLLSVVSFLSTFTGMLGLMEEVTAVPRWQAVALALLVTAAVQLLLVWSVWDVVHPASPRRWLAASAIYLIAVTASVGFGYGLWFAVVSGADHARAQFQGYAEEVARRASTARRAHRSLSAAMERLADYSRAVAVTETERGGTCGDHSPPREGPRARLRQRDAADFERHAAETARAAGEIGTLTTEVERLAASFRAAGSREFEQRLRRAYRELTVLVGDGRWERLREALRQRVEAGRQGILDPFSGKPVTCRDPRLDGMIADALAIQRPALPPFTVKVLAADDRGATTAYAFRHLATLIGERWEGLSLRPADVETLKRRRIEALRGSGEPAVAEATDEEWLPLAIGATVDGLIFLVALLAPNGGGTPPAWERLEGLQRERPRLTRPYLRQLAELLDLEEGRGDPAVGLYHGILRLTVRYGRHDYLLLPLTRQNRPETLRVKRLVDFLTALEALRLETTSITRLPRWLRAATGREGSGVPFALYRVERRFLSALLFEALRLRHGEALGNERGRVLEGEKEAPPPPRSAEIRLLPTRPHVV